MFIVTVYGKDGNKQNFMYDTEAAALEKLHREAEKRNNCDVICFDTKTTKWVTPLTLGMLRR